MLYIISIDTSLFCHWQTVDETRTLGEDAVSLGCHQAKMRAECHKKHPNLSILQDKMARTRVERRAYLENHSTMETLDEYPALRFPVIVSTSSLPSLSHRPAHLNQITYHHLPVTTAIRPPPPWHSHHLTPLSAHQQTASMLIFSVSIEKSCWAETSALFNFCNCQ